MRTEVARLDAALRAAGNPKRAAAEKRYLKSPLRHYGASVPAIRRAAKALSKSEACRTRQGLLEAVRALWAARVHEKRMAAVVLLEARADDLEARDLALVESMLRASFTWAYVDGLAANAAGPLVERHPRLVKTLDRWAGDESFWVRRAALLALLPGLRRGEGDWPTFVRLADGLLEDPEFFVRKAIGWVLRETSKRRPSLVREYVEARADRLSALSFREAIKRLPAKDQRVLRRARGSGRK